ncbi:MAG: hypothetical protein FJ403_04430 [Verrucomicrobia bacterium]|nr:hypothetical protein [Verrucomicrobiota bacterium]
MKVIPLSQRRASPVARAAAQPEELSAHYRRFENPAQIIEALMTLARVLRSPVVVAGMSALLINRRWRKVGHVSDLLITAGRLVAALNRSKE